jgi:hypothetical protein
MELGVDALTHHDEDYFSIVIIVFFLFDHGKVLISIYTNLINWMVVTNDRRENARRTAPKQNSPLRHWRLPIEKPNLEGRLGFFYEKYLFIRKPQL